MFNYQKAYLIWLMFMASFVLTAPTTNAAVIHYTSRAEWEAAVGTFSEEDFSSFTSDTSFHTSPVDVGPFTLELVGPGYFRNLIEVPLLPFTDNNGTAHASIWTDFGSPDEETGTSIPGTAATVTMTFAETFSAWGAFFYGATTAERLDIDVILDFGGGILKTIQLPEDVVFFGFVTDPQESLISLTFRSRNYIMGLGEGFGLDNVVWVPTSPAPIPEATMVPVDIKPGSCTNLLNTKSQGVLSVAILGTNDVAVYDVDESSITLAGISPIRSTYEDVATPFEPSMEKVSDFDCPDENPDGFLDLVLQFKTQEFLEAVEALLGREVEDNEVVWLTLHGNLLEQFDNTPIKGEDMVVIKKRGKEKGDKKKKGVQ